MAHIPRVYLSGRLGPGPLFIEGDGARRLGAVMRMREGQQFRVFAGDGREWAATVRAVGKATVHAEIADIVRQEPANPLVVELWCALVRPNRFDWAIEKCVEAGADIIRPLICEHSARGDGGSAARQERWRRIAVEAAEQSGRLYLPVVEPPAAFESLVARGSIPLFVGDRDGRPWSDAATLLPMAGRVAMAVGPEGGFSAEELRRARGAGAVTVTFGPHILRTETAAVVATALLRTR